MKAFTVNRYGKKEKLHLTNAAEPQWGKKMYWFKFTPLV
jgi:hypothetical protein